jgi:hypothetical protein
MHGTRELSALHSMDCAELQIDGNLPMQIVRAFVVHMHIGVVLIVRYLPFYLNSGRWSSSSRLQPSRLVEHQIRSIYY